MSEDYYITWTLFLGRQVAAESLNVLTAPQTKDLNPLYEGRDRSLSSGDLKSLCEFSQNFRRHYSNIENVLIRELLHADSGGEQIVDGAPFKQTRGKDVLQKQRQIFEEVLDQQFQAFEQFKTILGNSVPLSGLLSPP